MNVLNFTSRENVKMFIDSYEKNEGQIASFYEEGFLPYEPIEKIDEKQYNELLLAWRNVINASNYLSMSMSSRRPSLDVDEDEEDYELALMAEKDSTRDFKELLKECDIDYDSL